VFYESSDFETKYLSGTNIWRRETILIKDVLLRKNETARIKKCR